MRQSKLFTKTLRQAPKDELTKNAQLLIQAGFVNKVMAGAYSYLPMGLRVIRKIENIIREEMNNIGGQEVFFPALHPSEIWKKTGGWDSIDVLFKIKSRTEKDYALGQSHEEVVTPLLKSYISSYKDLPLAVYQIQQKFRDELRAKSGILRGREFGMKDMYSVHQDQADFDVFYEKAKQAYLKIYSRLGLVAKVTEASGGSFSQKISYEFMVLTDAGEDDIFYCHKCEHCVNVEISKNKEGDVCPKCKKGKFKKGRAPEVGNVFDLGQRYPKAFDWQITDEKGEKFFPIMGCYGIGVSRLMGVIVEKYNDEKGIIWPKSVAPYQIHLLSLAKTEDDKVFAFTKKLYEKLSKNFEVLWDDRLEASPGDKFNDADLIGCPIRLVVSEKTIKENKIEFKKRNESKIELVSEDELVWMLG